MRSLPVINLVEAFAEEQAFDQPALVGFDQ